MSEHFVINGHHFEDGFTWVALTSPSDKAIAAAMQDRGHGCYVSMGSKDGRDTISGLVLGTKEVRKGGSKSYSLAAFIYDVFRFDGGIGNFTFIRQLGDDGYYYLEVEGGYIQGGDVILSSLDQIHDVVSNCQGELFIDSPNAQMIADVHEYKDVSVRRIMDEHSLGSRHLIKSPNDARARQIRMLMWVIVAAGGLYAAYLGMDYIKEWWAEFNREEVVEKSQEQIALEKRAKAERIVGERLKSQTAGLSAFDVVEGCFDSYLFQGGAFDVGGWKMTDIKCTSSNLQSKYEQGNVYELSGEALTQRLSQIDGVKVRVGDGKDWLKTATLTVDKGYADRISNPGLFLEQLPNPNVANGFVMDNLKRFYMTGFGTGQVSQVRVSFPPEQEIPEELLYYEGRFSVQTSGLGQLVKVVGLLNKEWIKVTNVNFGAGEKSRLKAPYNYEAEFRYYFR